MANQILAWAAGPPWPRRRRTDGQPAGAELVPRAGHQRRRSFVEEVAVLGVVWFAIEHPVAAAASVAAVLLVVRLAVLLALLKLVRRGVRRRRGQGPPAYV